MSRSKRFSESHSLNLAWNDGLSRTDSETPIHSHGSGTQSKSSISGVLSTKTPDVSGGDQSTRVTNQPFAFTRTPQYLPALQITAPLMDSILKDERTLRHDSTNMQSSSRSPPEELINLRETLNNRRIFLDNDRRRSTAELRSLLEGLDGFVNGADTLTVLLSNLPDVQEKAHSL